MLVSGEIRQEELSAPSTCLTFQSQRMIIYVVAQKLSYFTQALSQWWNTYSLYILQWYLYIYCGMFCVKWNQLRGNGEREQCMTWEYCPGRT